MRGRGGKAEGNTAGEAPGHNRDIK